MTENDKVREELVRSISGKLSVGSALVAYNRLFDVDKDDYEKLIAKLTEEFIDPAEKRKFNGNISFNRRKKGQTVKEFMHEVKKDMNRYSTIADKISVSTADGAAMVSVSNPAKEREGVRRFRAGMRNKNGKKEKSLEKHLRYHLVVDTELTWDNAVEAAVRWEMANRMNESSSDDSDDNDGGDDDRDPRNLCHTLTSKHLPEVKFFYGVESCPRKIATTR